MQILFVVAIFFSYALQFYVLMEVVNKWMRPKFGNREAAFSAVEYIARIVINVLTCE